MSGAVGIFRFVINDASWTPIAPPIKCNYIVLKNVGAAMKMRSDPNDASTEDDLGIGVQYTVLVPFTGRGSRFGPMRPVCYVKGAPGTGTSEAILNVVTC